ncbi:MAG: ABC transporter substrate-binding protein [Reyranellaceae bacterium]
MKRRQVTGAMALAGLGALLPGVPATAQKKYGPGVTDTEIKIGQTAPLSGPASAYGQISRAEAAYFKWLNEKGGINGRKINLITLDDGYSPPKAVEGVRQLVESEGVALIFNVLGTPINTAIRPYLNQKKVPQLFIAAGSIGFADPKKYPWTIGWQPNLLDEARFYAQHAVKTNPNAKVGVLYQDDDFGKELVRGLTEGLGPNAKKLIVSEQSFMATDPTVDSQVIALRGAGVDTLFLFTYAKQAAQAIRKADDLKWKPATYLHLGSASVGATFKPAGLEASTGVMTAGFIKDPNDPKWADDADMKAWFAWMKANMPTADTSDSLNLAGYLYCQTLEQVLRQAGDNLTRENIMKQVASLKGFRLPLLLPGSLINTSPTDFKVIETVRLQRFNGKSWDWVD